MTAPWGSLDPTLRTTVLKGLINKTLAFLNSVHNPLSVNQPLTSVTEGRSNESNQFLKAIRVFPQLSYFYVICTAGSVCLVECESCFQTRMLSRIAISQQRPVVHFKRKGWKSNNVIGSPCHIISCFTVVGMLRGNWITSRYISWRTPFKNKE